MRDRARAGGDAGISAARPTRPMNWRATSRAEHSCGAARVAGCHPPRLRDAAVDAHARVAHLGQDAQEVRRRPGRIRIARDDNAALTAADDLELGVTCADPPAQPAQLLFRLETFEIEGGSEPAAVDLDAGRELEGCHGGEVHDEYRRVVVVEPRPFAKSQSPRRR